MSRSADLFIAFDGSLEDLATLIDARTPFEVRPRPDGDAYELTDGSLTAVLDRHRFVDDHELPLSRYPYDLALHTNAAGHLGASAEAQLLRDVAGDLDDLSVMLVLDLQYRDAAPSAEVAP